MQLPEIIVQFVHKLIHTVLDPIKWANLFDFF